MDAFTLLATKAASLQLTKTSDDTSTATQLGSLGTIGGGLTAGAGYGGQRLGSRYMLRHLGDVAQEAGESFAAAARRALIGGNAPPTIKTPTAVGVSKWFAHPDTAYGRLPLGGRGGGRAMMRGGGLAALIGAPLWMAGRGIDSANAKKQSLQQILEAAQAVPPQIAEPAAPQLTARQASTQSLRRHTGDAVMGVWERLGKQYGAKQGVE